MSDHNLTRRVNPKKKTLKVFESQSCTIKNSLQRLFDGLKYIWHFAEDVYRYKTYF